MIKIFSKKPPLPSIKEVERYLILWKDEKIYSSSEESLNRLFSNFPSNKNLNEIIIKVCSLDVIFSAGASRWFFEISNHILEYDFDTKLKTNTLDLNDFAKINVLDKKTKKLKERNFYSFATKYCNHHKSVDYPIYDSYVDKALWYFKNEYQYQFKKDFSREELRIYKKFKEILEEFRIGFKLQKFSLRDIDKYLWLLGKEYSPNNKKVLKTIT